MKIFLFCIFLLDMYLLSQAVMFQFDYKKVLKSSWFPWSTYAETRSHLFCSTICISHNYCNTLAYNKNSKECSIGRKEGLLIAPDGTPDSQIVEVFIQFTNYSKKVYSKVLVGFGWTGSLASDVEIIDLLSSTTTCQPLVNFPYASNYMFGGLGFQDKPIVCGGYNSPVKTACYLYNGTWRQSFSLNKASVGFAVSQSPFLGGSSKLFVTGGSTTDKSSEVLGSNGWQLSVPLPVAISYHCMVSLDPTTVMVIGGNQDGPISPNTFVFNSDRGVWSQGPTLAAKRIATGCGAIKMNNRTSDISLIAAGGIDDPGHLSSVEILDLQLNAWRSGPSLPRVISGGIMVEDPTGGVVLIGGEVTPSSFLNTLYYLPHAGSDASWVLLPQKLKTARTQHTAFLVPNEITTCN